MPDQPVTEKSNALRWVLAAVFAAAILAFFYFDAGRYLSLESLKAARGSLSGWVAQNFILAWCGFLLIYVAVAALSLPGAALLTLAAGAFFGLLWGTLAASFASTIGGTLAFLASRFLFGDAIRRKFAARMRPIEEGVKKDGAWYLLSLRMVPLVPFFVVNLLMGLTPMRAATFYGVSQIGMLPGTLAYVFAGTQLAQVNSLKGILSPGLLAAFAIVGLLPLVLKFATRKLQGSGP
jgi:uncharacterized membrane protein YdjX (TVP38/TMEM64 family)